MKVLQMFQHIFDERVYPYIQSISLEDQFSEPVCYTLRQPSNKFRSASALLVAELCGVNDEDVLPIAAVSEIIHSAIIVQDDIADRDGIRRGNLSAWKKYGICHALHAALYVIPCCLRILDQLPSENVRELIKVQFWNMYQQLCSAQIGQRLLKITANLCYDDFLEIHYGKTAIGRWAVRSAALTAGNTVAAQALDNFAKCLGDAGSLKNDLEDFMCNTSYEVCCSDIREGMVTYPLYFFFRLCSIGDREAFLRMFGQGDSDAAKLWAPRIVGAGVVVHCKEKIVKLVNSAMNQLHIFPVSSSLDLLAAWADYHNKL